MIDILNRKHCPNQLFLSVNDIQVSKLEPSENFLLANGLNVSVFYSASTEIIKLDFVFEAGTYQQRKVFEASFANHLLTEGSCKKTAKEIADFLDFRGAYIEKSIDKETATVTVYFLKKYTDDILPLLHEIILHPDYSEHEIELYTQKRKQQFLVDNQKVSFVAQTRFSEMIFGKNHPYGKLGTFEDFDKLTSADLKSFHNSFYKTAPFHIVISGNVTKNVLSLVNTHFGEGSFSNNNQAEQVKIETNISQQTLHIPMPNTIQSAIRIGKATINSQHHDYPMLLVLNTLLGGYFGSRLMKNIREEKGYTYGIYSILHSFRQSGIFFVTTEVGAEVTDLAITEIRNELKRLRTELIDSEELNLVKNYLIGEFIRNMDGVFEISERYKNLLQLSQSNVFNKSYIQAIAESTPQKLQILAEKYLHEDSMSTIRVG